MGMSLCVALVAAVAQGTDPAPPRVDRAEVRQSLVRSFWALMLPVIIIVGLRFGIFTPTEAGVVAAVYAIFVATCIYRELPMRRLYEVFLTSAKMTAMVMFWWPARSSRDG